MANPSKKAGTEGENWWMTNLVSRLWPNADRAKTNNPGNDVHGAPLPIEIKRRKTWLIPAWTRYLRELHGKHWMLLVSPRDKRRKDAAPDLVILPIETAYEILSEYVEAFDLDEQRHRLS